MNYDEIRRFEFRGVKTSNWCNLARRGGVVECYRARIGEFAVDSEGQPHADILCEATSPAKAADAVTAKESELVAAGFVELRLSSEPLTSLVGRDWRRIRTWLLKYTPAFAPFPLAKGANDETIERAEKAIGVRIPDDVRDSYRLHDGSNGVDVFPHVGAWLPLSSPQSNPRYAALVAEFFGLLSPTPTLKSLSTPAQRGERRDEVAQAMNEIERDEQLPSYLNTLPGTWQSMTGILKDGGFYDFVSNPRGPVKTDWWNERWIPFTDGASGDHLCIDLDPPKDGKSGQIIFSWHEVGAYGLVADSFGAMIHAYAERLEDGLFTFDERGAIVARDELGTEGVFRALGSKYF